MTAMLPLLSSIPVLFSLIMWRRGEFFLPHATNTKIVLAIPVDGWFRPGVLNLKGPEAGWGTRKLFIDPLALTTPSAAELRWGITAEREAPHDKWALPYLEKMIKVCAFYLLSFTANELLRKKCLFLVMMCLMTSLPASITSCLALTRHHVCYSTCCMKVSPEIACSRMGAGPVCL